MNYDERKLQASTTHKPNLMKLKHGIAFRGFLRYLTKTHSGCILQLSNPT